MPHDIFASSEEEQFASDEAAAKAWRHPGDVIAADARRELVEQLADALTPVLIFINKGATSEGMNHRVWVWQYETRRDLLRQQTIEEYAKFAGVSTARIQELINEFRSKIPAYNTRGRKGAATRARMGSAQKARHDAANTGAANSERRS